MTNFAALPSVCFGTHPTEGALILLKKGETGYWPAQGYSAGRMTWDELADHLNGRLGVTRAQRAAMEAGSIFGFHIPAADPARYDDEGRFR